MSSEQYAHTMLEPGVTLFVYGFTAETPLAPLFGSPGFVAVVDDDEWRYLVFTSDAKVALDDAGLAPDYEASLLYEQWLDGEVRGPIDVAGLRILHPWVESSSETASPLLHIEPGLAFGTGSHPTTRRCLELLQWLLEGRAFGIRLLDLGCGTGVLGLAALALGASSVHACDISRHAVEIARANAERNALADRCSIVHGPASELLRPAEIVIANLPPSALGELLEHPALEKSPWVISSGMLTDTFKTLRRQLPRSVTLEQSFVDGFWHTALLRRR